MASTSLFSSMGNKEHGTDEWNVVIKVKYGDTLRRFSAHVHQRACTGQQLTNIDYDMNQLRAKISSLFKFSHDADLVLTYTDEDGDVVCLDSDDELRDVITSQRLNPLRINVQLKPYATEGSHSCSKAMKNSDIRTATASPALNGFRQLATELNSAVDKSLKSLPDPIRGVLSNISHDVIRTVSSGPVFSELFSLLSKVQLSNDPQSSQERTDKIIFTSTGVPSSAVEPNTSEEPKVPTTAIPVSEYIQNKLCDGKSVDASKEQKGDCEAHLDGMSPAEPPSILFGSQSVPRNNHDTPTFFSCPSTLHPYRRPSSCLNYMARTFHMGVICDGCGMHPIIGPRYKSTVKENYDLCGTCFRDIGREPEYTRIDSAFHFPKSKKHHHKHNHRGRSFSTIVLSNRVKSPTPKLTSSFVIDVTVWDGTMVRPGSHFTKIWRMRNMGTVAWPYGTQLVWVGGHHLGIHGTSELEIPEVGFPVDCELDIAVDCIAPSVLGKYISYWQMASSSGQKFGDEVWISIQVCDSSASTTCSSPIALNLNLPPESNQPNGPVIIDVDSVPLGRIPSDDKLLEELLERTPPDMLNLTSDDFISVPHSSNDNPALSFNFTPVLQTSTDGLGSSSTGIPASSCPVSNPYIDIPALFCPFSNPANDIPASSVVSYPLIDISASPNPPDVSDAPSDNITDENLVELTLLKELEEMGFMQTDLNKDILRQNKYDLEQSVEELCEFAEWDPLLKELQEMGFNDRETNRKLLLKNGGSIKRVVMELVTGMKGE